MELINENFPSVAVIMSTYNGEKYIRELLDSVLNQKNVNVKVMIRDDGSTDHTVDIINGYNDNRIELVIGKNMGPAKSFLKAAQFVKSTDYCAYCDQDDIWKEDKLIRGVMQLQKTKDDKPALYMSTYEVVDKNLERICVRDMEFDRPITLQQTILFRAPSGCTMVFNSKLLQLIQQEIPENVRMHDFWTLQTALAFHGDIYTEDYPALKYRQHENNTVGIVPSARTRLKRLWKSATKNKNERMLQAASLMQCYGEQLPEDSLEILNEVLRYKTNIFTRISFARNKAYRWAAYENVLFIVSVLMGLF